MQKSRKSLLQRRASLDKIKIVEKKYLYKVSLSVVLLLWIHVFLLNSLISHGNGSNDEQHEVTTEPALHENHSNPDDPTNYENTPPLKEDHYENTPTPEGDNYEITPTVEGDNYETAPIQGNDGNTPTSEDEIVKNTPQNPLPTNEEIGTEPTVQSEKEERETNPQRTDRISRISPLPLDEFKNKAIISQGKTVNSQTGTGTGTVVPRLEPGGKEYNYASLNKGAKILSFNKEAKGASNILDKDKDKYLRNPCSVEGKFVILELSEETLVNTIEIANFEHYSSNLKDFEVFSSLAYPTEKWDKIGGFSANNSKHAQRFGLIEPKWARYLKFNFLSHYGNEFYCTLSSIEVYGVDAVERMLEDLISDEKNKKIENQNSEDQIENIPPPLPPQELIENEEMKVKLNEDNSVNELEIEQENENNNKIIKAVPESVPETKALQVGRIQGDTALKVLLQKVQGLDLNFSLLERYLEELNNRYGQIFKDFDDDMANKDLLLEKLTAQIKDLQSRNEILVNGIGEITDWKLLVSAQMDNLVRDNQILRFEVEKVKERQNEMENKGLAVILISFIFGSLAIWKLIFGALFRMFRFSCEEKFCRNGGSGWGILLFSCSIIAFIMVI